MSFSEWQEVNLGNITKIKGRIGWKGYKTSDLREYGPVVLGGNNIKNSIYLDLRDVKHLSRDKYEESPEIMLKENDILVVTRGNGIGDISFFNGSLKEATINPSMVILSDCTENPKFLFYYLISPVGRGHILSVRSGSSIPAIYQKSLATIKCLIPTLYEQKAIADTLSCLDDKIELNNCINKNLEELAQAIFKNWFVDFEPFQDGEFEDSELGRIPKGWRVGSIYEICNVIYGAAFKSKLFNEDKIGLPLVRIRDLKTFEPQIYTDEKHPKAEIVHLGDILVGMDAEFRPFIWKGKVGVLNQRVCKFDPKYDYVNKYFINSIIKPHMEFIENFKVGTTVSHIGKGDIDKIKIIIPTQSILSNFRDIVEPLFKRILNNSIESITLTEIRDNILPKLTSGEIRIPIQEV